MFKRRVKKEIIKIADSVPVKHLKFRQCNPSIKARQKLTVARNAGLSESADFALDFYRPTRQIAHCGHFTFATCAYL